MLSRSRCCFVASALLAAGFVLAATAQQEEDQLSNNVELPALHKKFAADIKATIRGEREPTAEVLDVLAKWYAYRPTWTGFKETPAKLLNEVVNDFETQVVREAMSSSYASKNRKFVAQFGKPLADRYRELFKRSFNTYYLALANSAQMLPIAARLKQEEVGDLLAELVADPAQHDSVKVFALKGMIEYFPAKVVGDDELIVDAGKKDTPITTKKNRDAKRIQTLVDYMERKWPADMDPDVVRYLRREAITSLAQAGVPAVTALKKSQKVEGPVAYALMKVLAPGGLRPAPTTSEKIEAIIGLCKIKLTPSIDGYDPVPATALISHGLLDVFNDYRGDWPEIKGGGKVPKVAWRLQAERLKQGLVELVANTKDTPASKDAVRIEGEAKSQLGSMQAKGYGPVNTQLFEALVKEIRPKAKSGPVYKKHPGHDLVIDFNATEEAAGN